MNPAQFLVSSCVTYSPSQDSVSLRANQRAIADRFAQATSRLQNGLRLNSPSNNTTAYISNGTLRPPGSNNMDPSQDSVSLRANQRDLADRIVQVMFRWPDGLRLNRLSDNTTTDISNGMRRLPGSMHMAARQGRRVVSLPYQYGNGHNLQTHSNIILRPVVRPSYPAGNSGRLLDRHQSPIEKLRAIFGSSFDVNLEKSRDNAMRESVRKADTEAIQLLLNEGTSMESRDERGRTHLILSILSKSRPVIDVLLKSGADPNAPDQSGNTPMMYAAEQNDPYLIYKLRRAGGVTDARDQYGNTVLIAAIEHHHLQAVRSLLDRNTEGSMAASPEARNALEATPLSVAIAIRVQLDSPWYSRLGGISNFGRIEVMKNNKEIISLLHNATEIIHTYAA